MLAMGGIGNDPVFFAMANLTDFKGKVFPWCDPDWNCLMSEQAGISFPAKAELW